MLGKTVLENLVYPKTLFTHCAVAFIFSNGVIVSVFIYIAGSIDLRHLQIIFK